MEFPQYVGQKLFSKRGGEQFGNYKTQLFIAQVDFTFPVQSSRSQEKFKKLST